MSHAQVYGPTLRRIENLLKRLEWCDDGGFCPECGGSKRDFGRMSAGHDYGCELKVVIDKIQECE